MMMMMMMMMMMCLIALLPAAASHVDCNEVQNVQSTKDLVKTLKCASFYGRRRIENAQTTNNESDTVQTVRREARTNKRKPQRYIE